MIQNGSVDERSRVQRAGRGFRSDLSRFFARNHDILFRLPQAGSSNQPGQRQNAKDRLQGQDGAAGSKSQPGPRAFVRIGEDARNEREQ